MTYRWWPRWPVDRWSRTAVVLVVVLLVASGILLLPRSHPPLAASVEAAPIGAGEAAQVSLTNGVVPISASVALVPGRSALPADRTVLFLADSQLPSLYSPYSTTLSIGTRVDGYFGIMRAPLSVVDVTTAQVAGAIADHPYGTLVMVGSGVIPDTLYSARVSVLHAWIAGGGTVVWAGGPFAYSEGHPTDSGFVYSSLRWSGQTRFFGFPLSDPVNVNSTDPADFPPLYGTLPTPLGADLGLVYTGTASGANVTQVETHGGVTLGVRTPAISGAAPRTSLAYLPVGSGGVWFFGGALFSPPVGYIPQASVNLSEDIALVLGLGYRPVDGPSEGRVVDLAALAATTVTLSVPDRSNGVVVIVRGQTEGALLYFFSETLAAPSRRVPKAHGPPMSPGRCVSGAGASPPVERRPRPTSS